MSRRTLWGLVVLLLLVWSGPADAGKATSKEQVLRSMRYASHAGEEPAPKTACATEAADDTLDAATGDNLHAPAADIVRWCATYGDGLVLRMRVADPVDPAQDHRWQAYSFALWQIDANDDGDADFDVYYSYSPELSAKVYRTGSDEVRCETGAFFRSGDLLTGSISRACLGGRVALAISAVMLMDTGPDDPEAPLAIDETTMDLHVQGDAPAPGTSNRDARRLAGSTRFETAAALSREAFPDGAMTVYLVRADSAADLAAASALTLNGPILPVPACGDLPDAIRDEILRLAAMEVVAIGGADAICERIVLQAAAA